MNRPILLLKKQLIFPFVQALDRIEEIRQRKANNNDHIILEGLFVLSVATFETSIADSLRVLLYNIPEKLDIKSEVISKDQLINGNPLTSAIESKVNAITYKSLPEIINCFTKISGIKENVIDSNDLDVMIEIKATRNLLLHNNLIINSFYKDSAGIKARNSTHLANRLDISQEYLIQSLFTIRKILENLKEEFLIKYSEFTKINAIKKLFKYIFPSPVMQFDNEFEVDEERDTISSIKEDSSKNGALSSSEKLYYDI